MFLNLLAGGTTLAAQVAAILRKYGTDAHVYLPGIGVINGLTAGNYLDSAGTTAATVDNPVGLVVDSGGINAIQATTANKPILRRGAVNLLTYSEDFDNAAWSKQRATISSNVLSAPNGYQTADKLTEDTQTGNHTVFVSISVTSGVAYTFSVYIKAAERGFAQVRYSNAGSTEFYAINVNLSDGTYAAVSFGSPTGTLSSVTPVGNGWYKCAITSNTTNTTFTAQVFSQLVQGANSYTGDNTSGIYLWGAQLETGSVATTYIQTTTAAASSATGNYHWVHDSTDLLTATFPAGYESATIVDTPKSGQATLTAQNIVGTYNIGPSIDTYGRFIFRTGLTDSELAIIQSFANRLAGV